ncbi:MAG: LapA family protein [Hyphomicrobiales bacterium]|uniref:lipopolysaccharide assembly protein LapA domain-containing protein n=1 Tax=Rhabdaerophilum calidifontis TaxID=2604328 RepID=UPI00123B6539|nr:LapA family protein [Rhabdaerophilum calidifontis]MCA1952587.1 LapA family protein [Hyphomicrobiales bacterium]MCA1998243.1 LapA family protein [Hyphomicrobiales bacterium]
MLRVLKLLVILPVAALLILFAVANRQPVTLILDPFGAGPEALRVTIPLFAFFFVTLAIGIVVGSVTSWFAQGRHRRAERHFRRECTRLEGENARLKGAGGSASAALSLRD